MKNITNEPLQQFHEYNILYDESILYLGSCHDTDGEEGGVDYKMAQTLIKNIWILDKKGTDNPITIIMNNLGGDVYHGLAIYDAIKQCGNETRIIVMGYAMSMGAIILQAATHRLMSENATLMIHDGNDCIEGHPRNLKNQAQESSRLNLLCLDILHRRTSIPKKKLIEMSKFDTYLSASKAVAMGFADHIWKG